MIQSLVAVSLRLQMAEGDVGTRTVASIGQAAEVVSDAIDAMRTLVFELYPPALERHGLVAALQGFGASRCPAETVTFTASGRVEGSSLTAQAIAYRVAREAISNAVVHASASTITVRVQMVDHNIGVYVGDDGVGFDARNRSVAGGHIGLMSSEELIRDVCWRMGDLEPTRNGDRGRFLVPRSGGHVKRDRVTMRERRLGVVRGCRSCAVAGRRYRGECRGPDHRPDRR